MKVIICVDDKGGVAFNGRRQSRDREVIKKIFSLIGKTPLYMSDYSAALFEKTPQLRICEDYLSAVGDEGYCFAERESLKGYEKKVKEVLLFRWNRVYPADTYLELDLTSYKKTLSEEFTGYSHERITVERYETY